MALEETAGARDSLDLRNAPIVRYTFDGERFFVARLYPGDKEPRFQQLDLSVMDDMGMEKKRGWFTALGKFIGNAPQFAADENFVRTPRLADPNATE